MRRLSLFVIFTVGVIGCGQKDLTSSAAGPSASARPTAEKIAKLPDIFQAIQQKDITKLKAMVAKDKGAVNRPAPKSFEQLRGATPLPFAVQTEFEAGVAYLLASGADPNGTGRFVPVMIAVRGNNPKILQMLLEKGANPNKGVKGRDGDIRHPLQVAAANPRQTDDKVRLLLAKGADPNAGSTGGTTALVGAIMEIRDPDLVAKMLIDKGCDVNATDPRGNTALGYAAFRGDVSLIHMLVEHGAKLNIKNHWGITPLYEATRHGGALVSYLIAHGADVNVRTNTGLTPMHTAVTDGDEKVIGALLAAGAKPNPIDNRTETPLDRAGHFGQKQHSPEAAARIAKNVTFLKAHGGKSNAIPSSSTAL